ncbi:endo alpha-1,4 polygalactosaminidase [Pandoraea sp. XY-2]|uniref:endo alpha-1,4 polygalactosaminidase n=1 Tax=Pandoraea sp. XY-2 TaxID=2518599 RepID=UPI00101B1E44|nr:endo alpha-1,4 polygalactosaminidase [Pandoraea sp. XY-2]QBC33031.1 glycoside hydrolase [Pandoraea sp. XY-2]
MSWLRCVLCVLLALTALVSSAQTPTQPRAAVAAPTGRDIGIGAPWVSYYGNVAHLDLARMASTFRLIDIDADPDQGNVTPAQIATLKADGTNRVISYLNLGACERFRSYWQHAPAGFLPCGRNRRAHLGRYDGYRDETWMNPSDPAYRKLIVSYVAPRLIAQGVEGFYLDNLELIEHGVRTRNGPCDTACQQGALDLVRELREAFPDKILVMQNATGPATRHGLTGGVAFASLLDGIAHEEVYAPTYDAAVERELLTWSREHPGMQGRKLWIGTLDYVGGCGNARQAKIVFSRSRARGFSPSVSDASAGQNVVCYWGF